MQGIYALYRYRLFNFYNVAVNCVIIIFYLSLMRIPSSIVREYIGTIFFFIFQVQIISVLIDENWNPILQILPVRKSDYFVAYVRVILIQFVIYLACTIWFDTMITKLFLLFVVAPVACLYYCLHNFKNMTVVKSNNMYIRYIAFIIFTVLFVWIRNQLELSKSVIVYGNLICFGIIVILMLACMYEIRKEESI
mgnify:FL=1